MQGINMILLQLFTSVGHCISTASIDDAFLFTTVLLKTSGYVDGTVPQQVPPAGASTLIWHQNDKGCILAGSPQFILTLKRVIPTRFHYSVGHCTLYLPRSALPS